jgi:hypothetical protein
LGKSAIISLFVVFFLLVNFVPALPRFQVLGIVIAIAVGKLDFFKRNIKAAFCASAFVFLFTIFPIMKMIAFTHRQPIGNDGIFSYLLSVDMDAYMQIASTYSYIAERPDDLRWGMNFLGALLFFVPRSLWPEKPIGSGEIVSSALGYHYNNVSCPLPAEAFIAFGWLGCIVIMSLFGLMIGRIETASNPKRDVKVSIRSALLYCLTAGFTVITLRGALNAVAPLFASAFAAYALITKYESLQIAKRLRRYSRLTLGRVEQSSK